VLPRYGFVVIRNLRWLAALLVLGLVMLLVQHQGGIGLRETISLSPSTLEEKKLGYESWRKLPREHHRLLSHDRIVVLEDGKPIGFPVRSNREVREKGEGRYRVLDGSLRFSASDSSDAGNNGRTYEASLPVPVRPELLGGVAGGLALVLSMLWWRARRSGDARALALPWIPQKWDLLLILGLALALRIWVLASGAYGDGGLVVRGMPFSDAKGWNEMAIGLAEGKGITGRFDGHRPLYAIYLGGIYTVLGNHLVLGKLLNVVAGTLACGFLYLLGAATGSRVIGWALGMLGCFGAGYLSGVHPTATEALGFLLTLMSLYLFWRGLTLQRAAILFLAGLFFAAANLTRTFTILAFPGYCALIVLFTIRGTGGFPGFLRRSLVPGIAFCAGVFLALTPWLIRQKMVHGAFTISTNSADVLYGATTPEGKWNPAQFDEAVAAGVGENNAERHAFFGQRLAETVKEDPGKYVRDRWENLKSTFEWFDPKDGLFPLVASLALLLMVLLAWSRGAWLRALLVSVALATLWWFLPLPGSVYWLLPVSSLLVLGGASRGEAVLLLTLVTTFLAGLVMSALIGNITHLRSIDFLSWIASLIHLLAMHALLTRSWFVEAEAPVVEPEPRSSGIFAGLTVAWFLLTVPAALLLVGWKMKTRDESAFVFHQLSPQAREEVRSWAGSAIPSLGTLTGGRDELFYASPVSIGQYRIQVEEGDVIDHEAALFAGRKDARTIAFIRQGVDERGETSLQGAVLPGTEAWDVSKGDFLAVGLIPPEGEGVFREDNRIVEVLALVPYDRETRSYDLDSAHLLEESPRALRILNSDL